MRKVVIKISQGSVVTQTVLGGLTIHLPVANFLCFISAKNYKNWMRVDKVIAVNTVCSFLAHPVYHIGLHQTRVPGYPGLKAAKPVNPGLKNTLRVCIP